jgi:NAD-dependent dihydropyrimidine dehydrogenase PreA subunit
MPYVVTDACIKDFACVSACPSSAIAPAEGDAKAATVSQVYINPDDCIDCGSCADACPANAIVSEDDLPADKAQFVETNKAFFKK